MKSVNLVLLAAVLTIFVTSALAQVSSGTAFAVAPGLLVTNQHVVDSCASVEVVAADGRRRGEVVDADALIDLALIRVPGLKGATARLRTPRNVRLGESVMVFGFPLSGSLTSGGNFTSGLVSGLRGLRDAAGEIQITAPVQPGNSGGPVIDASGLVVGVVQAKLDALRSAIATGDIPQNVNFAISLDVLADFLAKNRVAVRDAITAKPLDTASVAELAQSFTYRVECRGTAQQTARAPKPPATTRGPNPSATISAGRSFKDCDDCPEMVMIPAGTFLMGSKADPFASLPPRTDEQPQHQVTIKSFAIGKHEVTQEQWYAMMGTLPSNFKGRTLPVEQVSWDDTQDFVRKLSEKTGKNYRLPSEAEWEYAARAGSQTIYYFGDSENESSRYAWSYSNSGNTTHPVGEKLPNAFGLYDMLGNVWEWTADCRNGNYNGAPTDGAVWASGDCRQRVLRGGAWDNFPQVLPAAYRSGYHPTIRVRNIGFRLARTD